MSQTRQEGFSAPVSLDLVIGGESYELSHVGPDTVRLRETLPGLEGTPAKLIITVGSTRKTQDIILSKCSPTDPKEVSYW